LGKLYQKMYRDKKNDQQKPMEDDIIPYH